jgi:hypothetical protein
MEGNFGEWCLVLVILLFVMLELERLEKNPGPPAEQDKTDHILKQIMHYDRRNTVVQNLLETHGRKTGEVKKGNKGFRIKFD